MPDPSVQSTPPTTFALSWDIVLIALKFLAQMLPSAFGSLVSLRFLPEGLSKGKLLTAWISAWAIGTFIGRGAAEYLTVTNERVSDALMFGFALFGLSLAGAILNEIPSAIKSFRERFLGIKAEEAVAEPVRPEAPQKESTGG